MYGGRSDDLEYMQEVLKTAERLGDKAYIQRLKTQIEEIKKQKSQVTSSLSSKKIAKKEDALKTSEAKKVGKLGDRCTPIASRQTPGSCETGTVCWSGVNKCCSRHASGEFYDCGEAGISPIKGSLPTTPAPTSSIPSTLVSTPVPTSSTHVTPVRITDGKMTESPTTMTPTIIKPTDSEKKVIGDYFDLKMSILKNIQELHKLKMQKDKLLNVVGNTPQLVFHNKQTTMDDCIRDENGKVLQC
jgi:hypothetical protein